MKNYFGRFYLDKEKDVVVTLFKEGDRLSYELTTPNHKTGNLITGIAKAACLPLDFDDNGMKVIRCDIPAFITSRNTLLYVLRMGGIKVANIHPDGRISQKATMPAVSKTLMAQTKDYQLSIDETLVKSYILADRKFRSDLHTHMNGNLSPDILIALGIYHQIRYPLYYIKKLNLQLSENQKVFLSEKRKIVEKDFVDSPLVGKYLDRKIDDKTYLNFADLILNNEYRDENIKKIRCSLAILKDSQAVFTNLEKLYLYRYVFTKAKLSKKRIRLSGIDLIGDEDIRSSLKQMVLDHKGIYKNNSLFQDKLLWIGREFSKQGIYFTEISDTTLVKNDGSAIRMLEDIHDILPKVKEETGVDIRFLAAIRRMPLTIMKDKITPYSYLRDNLDVLKVTGLDPYVVGVDIVGEEVNDIEELEPVIKELVEYAGKDPYFTIRIHAGENGSLKENVENSVACVLRSLKPGQKFPFVRLGHGLYTCDLNSKKGKQLIKDLRDNGVVLEFQLTSNVRLNNLTDLNEHPLKTYLKHGIKCVQGTDGQGLYGTTPIEEQLALSRLLKLSNEDVLKMYETEKEIIDMNTSGFKIKSKKFEKFLNGRSISDGIQEEIDKSIKKGKELSFKNEDKLLSEEVLVDKIKALPLDKLPVIIAGGSFNAGKRRTKMIEEDKKIIDKLLEELNPDKCYFVVGNKMQGYEKYLVGKNKKFEIYAIVPALIEKEEYEALNKAKVNICVSIEAMRIALYKSFNYEIFERIPSVVIGFDGNAACENLIQEAKNGKAKAKIYVSENSVSLKEKALSLKGYVRVVDSSGDFIEEFR